MKVSQSHSGHIKQLDSIKIYVGGLHTADYLRTSADHTFNKDILRKTFMSRWTHFFAYFQVLFMLAVMINLLTFSGILFAQKLYLDPEEVFRTQVEQKEHLWNDGNPAPTRESLACLSIIFRIVIICVVPAAIFIYRSRLLTLESFLIIKKQRRVQKDGVTHSSSSRLLHILFCCSRLRKLNYIEFVQFRNKNMHRYELVAEFITGGVMLLIAFFYFWNESIDEFKLPWYYLYLINMTLFQKFFTFIFKMLAFFPVYFLTRCCSHLERRRERQKMHLENSSDSNANNSRSQTLSQSGI